MGRDAITATSPKHRAKPPLRPMALSMANHRIYTPSKAIVGVTNVVCDTGGCGTPNGEGGEGVGEGNAAETRPT